MIAGLPSLASAHTKAHNQSSSSSHTANALAYQAQAVEHGKLLASVRYAAWVHSSSKGGYSKTSKGQGYAGGNWLQCVPFARNESGIEIVGNAANWWEAAAGTYERGHRPEQGAVLNFRSTGGMHLGHVAVVTEVVNAREVIIDHANWTSMGHGNIARGMSVVDVSPRNDWSAVRVELGHSSGYGSVYPTYGFIYDRPDHGAMVANDLPDPSRSFLVSRPAGYDEVAEAPLHSRNIPEHIDLGDGTE